MSRRPAIAVLIALLAIGGGGALARALQARFDHWQHRELFPTCAGCHAGAREPARSLWPAAGDCASCHDGRVEAAVEWIAPMAPRASNLRFTHASHGEAMSGVVGPDSLAECRDCHAPAGADPMQVRAAVVENCLTCHGVRGPHLETPDSACATCHVPLASAARLSRAAIGKFSTPQSHAAPDFAAEGHGAAARMGRTGVAASCATCHARDLCLDCHVNAPEVPAIQALALDPRSLAQEAELRPPPSHADPEFIRRHGKAVNEPAAKCATCHTRESCSACHVGSPAIVQAFQVAAAGRGSGAPARRVRPASHGADFAELHAEPASSRPRTCIGCHARTECLSCHRPDAADAAPGYHPEGFLVRHPSAAYARQSTCSDCHSQGQFCANCHLDAGLGSTDGLRGAGYHDAKQGFLLNHGQAARQSLESCVSCHSERDCLTCHSAAGGRRFNPHGPGFDPGTLRRKNPSMCTACHGAAIPGG